MPRPSPSNGVSQCEMPLFSLQHPNTPGKTEAAPRKYQQRETRSSPSCCYPTIDPIDPINPINPIGAATSLGESLGQEDTDKSHGRVIEGVALIGTEQRVFILACSSCLSLPCACIFMPWMPWMPFPCENVDTESSFDRLDRVRGRGYGSKGTPWLLSRRCLSPSEEEG